MVSIELCCGLGDTYYCMKEAWQKRIVERAFNPWWSFSCLLHRDCQLFEDPLRR